MPALIECLTTSFGLLDVTPPSTFSFLDGDECFVPNPIVTVFTR